MTFTNLNYPLIDGFIHDWLVAGPVLTPAPEGEASSGLMPAALLQRFAQAESGVTEPPVDLGSLGAASAGDPYLLWRYHRCRSDHLVDFTARHARPVHLRAWAYAQLDLAAAQSVTLRLTARGPAELWVNGQSLLRTEAAVYRQAVSASLPAGRAEILIRCEQAGVRAVPFALALQVEGAAAEVRLPTSIEPKHLEYRAQLERVIAAADLDRYVYGFDNGDRYNVNEPIVARFDRGLDERQEITLRLQSLPGDIFQEATEICGAATELELAKSFPLRNGPHHLALLPIAKDYYEHRLRFDRKELFYVVRTPYSFKAAAAPAQRAKEALEDAAERRGGSLYTEIAKMHLERWNRVHMATVTRALDSARERLDGSALDLLGLLGLRLRHRRKKLQLPDIRLALKAAALAFRYAPEDGGGSLADGQDLASESAQIVAHACEILAGRLWPQETFVHTGQNGAWHRARGEAAALAWMRQRGQHGFEEWNAPAAIEASVAALTHLVDLADSDPVSELAFVLLDKLFFTLAVNTFHGTLGAAQARASLDSVLSGRLQPTTGLARLLWARGNLTEAVAGQVSLALCRRYELPDLMRQIALGPVDAFWSQELHAWPGGEANLAVYKTRDFMLSCAQDYSPGQPGRGEHIWQATLGYDAVVFTNHPANLSQAEVGLPNLWAGNGVLPRAVMWGDVLLAAYQLPEDDWLGFTHAYFPVRAFDEHALEGGWAFARKGDAYLALTAQRGFDLTTRGPTAWRELRSAGHDNIWICHLGQALLDGSFVDFQQKIRALEVDWEPGAVRLTSLRGDRLAFGWQGPLLVNDAAQNLAGPNHIENSYGLAPLPATHVDVAYQGDGLRLKFE